MSRGKSISQGIIRAKLERYQLVVDEYNAWKSLDPDIPTTAIHRKHIKPKFGISLRTLNTILGTNIKSELKKIDPTHSGLQKDR